MPASYVQKWKALTILCGLLIAYVAMMPVLRAQEPTPPAPLQWGDYTLSGTGSFGYRFVDVGGNQGKYDDLLNLQQGFRLFDGEVDFQSKGRATACLTACRFPRKDWAEIRFLPSAWMCARMEVTSCGWAIVLRNMFPTCRKRPTHPIASQTIAADSPMRICDGRPRAS